MALLVLIFEYEHLDFSEEKTPNVVENKNELYVWVTLKSFWVATQIHKSTDKMAMMVISNITADECFMNLKYRHIPVPNCLKELSGLVVLQQQK